jgi:DNA mismatch repair protein MutS
LTAKVNKDKETPLMKQYKRIKAKYPGALLLFRVGDFYETFGEDAIKTAKILDIVLTKRSNGKASEVELAGFPHHALDNYLPRLVRAGQRVAICDQLEDPKTAKTIVKRGVTELVTPGVASDQKVLDSKKNNYLAVLCVLGQTQGLSLLDLSTGEFMLAEGDEHYIEKLLLGFRPSEVIFSKKLLSWFDEKYNGKFYTYTLDDWIFEYDFSHDRLLRQFEVKHLKGFGIESMQAGIISAGAALYYLEQTHHHRLEHISSISRVDEDAYVWLDSFSIRNLEILQSLHPNGKALIDILDKTLTPMGSRLMRKWLVLPLKSLPAIKRRHEIVHALKSDTSLQESISEQLLPVHDLERLISRLSMRKANPKEVLQLARSISAIEQIQSICQQSDKRELIELAESIRDTQDVKKRIQNSLTDDPPVQVQKGGVIRTGIDEELDEYRQLIQSGKDTLINLQKEESEKTGISSLKIGFNNVFGYYLEVTNAHKSKVPAEWIRKQTLTNAERYITEELKYYEDRILNAEDKIMDLESRLYDTFIESLLPAVQDIQHNARLISELDCLLSFAVVSLEWNYCKPQMNEGDALALNNCRHPVIEQMLSREEGYVPNDLLLNRDEQQLIILTGPNMSGKSAVLRQTALAALMAQCGCFVAADHAEIGWVDKIYTRVGASDNISQGESTFMVEMTETAGILNNLSERSLILLDEIGRGTSTYDGVSLAWSIAEYLVKHPSRAKTIFATHYHELNELEEAHQGIVNYHISTKEIGKKVIFLRKLERGGSEHSFGIHVARMAGIPKEVVKRSSTILHKLEKERAKISGRESLKKIKEEEIQLNLFSLNDPKLQQLCDQLGKLDINTLSPVEALLKLNELKALLDN